MEQLTPQSEEEWQLFYQRYSAYLDEFRVLGKKIGYKLHEDKLFLLLPPHAPEIDPTTRSTLPTNLQITREGRKISGAFIGTDEYVEREMTSLAEQALTKLKKIETLGIQQPQIAMRLLKNLATSTLIYSCRVTPPRLMQNAVQLVDTAVRRVKNKHP